MSDENNEDESKVVPISAAARRVLGVLVEKAKTTPDNYPLSLAGLITGCNQKSNRSPKMEVDEGDVLAALVELREVGAAREVQGNGRVTKYRHAAYDWMDLDSPQAAVMTELLLRGPQTAGEIRTRASRMSPLADMTAAQDVLDQLITKELVESLTPPGRGQTFAHKLYTPDERQYLEARIEKQAAAAPSPKKSLAEVDKLLQRLDSVNERIDQLEERIKNLEALGGQPAKQSTSGSSSS